MNKRRWLLVLLVYALLFTPAVAEDASHSEIPAVTEICITEEQLADNDGVYLFLNALWGCTPEEFENLTGIMLGEAEEADFPNYGFSRKVFTQPKAELGILSLKMTRMNVEFRNDSLWCVDGSFTSVDGVSNEYQTLLDHLIKLNGEPDHIVIRTSETNPMGMKSELRRWVGEYENGLISSIVLQISGKDEYTSLGFGWMLAEPDKIVTE